MTPKTGWLALNGIKTNRWRRRLKGRRSPGAESRCIRLISTEQLKDSQVFVNYSMPKS
jgi:hypothetical protein